MKTNVLKLPANILTETFNKHDIRYRRNNQVYSEDTWLLLYHGANLLRSFVVCLRETKVSCIIIYCEVLYSFCI